MSELPTSSPRLRAVLVPQDSTQTEHEWRFEGNATIVIGRGRDSDIRLEHTRVSRAHAMVKFDGSDWQCSCPGQNGTYLNGEIVPAITITDGLMLEFSAGGPVLRFLISESCYDEPDISVDGDVTIWLNQLIDGDNEAAENIYAHYFEQISNLAKRRMSPAYRRVADEEDVAQSVMRNLFDGISNGRYPELSSRENLWRLLVVMTARKAINVVEKQRAKKRGGGNVRGESIFQGPDSSEAAGFDRFAGASNTPDFIVQLAEESRRQIERLADEVLQQVARFKMEGYTNDEIAEKLGTTTRTVERKLQRIRELRSDEMQ